MVFLKKVLISIFISESLMNEIEYLSEENNKLKINFVDEIKKIQKKQANDLFFLEVKALEITSNISYFSLILFILGY